MLNQVVILCVLSTAWSQGVPSNQHGNWDQCVGVQDGTQLPKISDAQLPLNEPCYGRGNHCNGYMVCCVTRGTCLDGVDGHAISSNKAYYEGGCQSKESSEKEWDAGCTQQGECHVGYIASANGGIHAEESYMTTLPEATMARLMTGSNYNIERQGCGNFTDWDQCSNVKSGVNLPKPTDGREPTNEPCYGHNGHAKGYPVSCVKKGTCLTNHSGSAISSNKAYYEGGCQSKESSNKEWDEGCTQQGECLIAFISTSTGGLTVAGHLEMPPDQVMDRIMEGSNWNTTTRGCGASSASASTDTAASTSSNGCYDSTTHQCTCPPDVSESTCSGTWTDQCTSCASSSSDTTASSDADPHAGHDLDHDDDASPTPKPEPSTPDTVVKMTLTVAGVVYDDLAANTELMANFTTNVKTAVAAEAGAGIEAEHVEVALSAGSVKVEVTITPPADVSVAAVKDTLGSSTTMTKSVVDKVSEDGALLAIATGTITAVVTVAPSTAQAELESESNPDPGISGAKKLTDHATVLGVALWLSMP